MKPSALGTGSLAELTSRRPNARTTREVEHKREVRAFEELVIEAALAWYEARWVGFVPPSAMVCVDLAEAVSELLSARRGRKSGPKKIAP